MPVDHPFGGQHTELKLSVIEKYLKQFSTALRGKFSELWYIDAFAGTGTRTIKHEERPAGLLGPAEPEKIEQRRGSAQIAIDVAPNFDRIIFIESKPSHVQALIELKAKYPDREIEIIKGDANQALQSAIKWDGWASTRAVLFLDPYGMEVDWATLEAIAKTKAIDVWFLFPLAGLFRQATRKITDIDEHKRAALTRMFGSEEWEGELYPKNDRPDLFGDFAERERLADVAGLERYVKGRLEKIFPKVLKPLALPVDTKPQRYSLFLCISNDEPKAIGLATRIGNHILKAGSSS
jgi:three-Cys-motif partner protein